MSRNLAALMIFVSAFAISSGCSHVRIHRTQAPPVPERVSYGQPMAIWGYVELNTPVVLKDQCKTAHWQQLDVKVTFVQALLRVATLNLYSPWTAEVACAVPPPPRSEFDDEEDDVVSPEED